VPDVTNGTYTPKHNRYLFCSYLGGLACLEVVEGRAHDTLGHGRLELAAKLAHFHLEIPEDVVLFLRAQELVLLGVSGSALAIPEQQQKLN